MRSYTISIFLYAYESWTLTAELQRRIQAMEMKCYRKILHIQRPCYQRGNPRHNPAGNRTTPTQRPPDHRKETQTEVVWTCLLFISSGTQKNLARHSENEKQTRQTEEEVGRQYHGMERPGVHQVPEGSGKQGKMEETGCKIICGAPTTFAIKG